MAAAGAGSLLGPRPSLADPIRIGFQVWGQSTGWADLMAVGSRIEALGFASLFANDHLMPILGDGAGPVVGATGPVFEAWMTLGGWATLTHRVPLGVLVCGVGYRNVGLTIKMATALDHATQGRAILGLGAGWHAPEHAAFGFGLPTLGERIDRLDATSSVARRLLDGEAVTADGPWVVTRDLRNDPPPVQPHMPLLIGGSGERRTLRIVARDADLWNGEGDPATFAHKSRVLDAHCAEIGRDPASIRRTVGIPPICIRDSRPAAVDALTRILAQQGGRSTDARAWAEASPLADTEEIVARRLRDWHAAGAEEAIADLPWPNDLETLERLAGPVQERLA